MITKQQYKSEKLINQRIDYLCKEKQILYVILCIIL